MEFIVEIVKNKKIVLKITMIDNEICGAIIDS